MNIEEYITKDSQGEKIEIFTLKGLDQIAQDIADFITGKPQTGVLK